MTYFETDSETNDTIEAELRQCMQEKRLARSECPLQWWKQNSWEVKDLKVGWPNYIWQFRWCA